jgi:hypothetical protein
MRCDQTDQPRRRLIVAPDDLLLSPHEAAGVPAERLTVWCPRCHDRARSRQKAAAANLTRIQTRDDPPPALF